MSGCEALKPVVIPVMMDRKLHVEAQKPKEASKAIVKSTFKELCEANLGSADYYALCKMVSTVYVSGVCQFKADEFDFVRRFVTLIDLSL